MGQRSFLLSASAIVFSTCLMLTTTPTVRAQFAGGFQQFPGGQFNPAFNPALNPQFNPAWNQGNPYVDPRLGFGGWPGYNPYYGNPYLYNNPWMYSPVVSQNAWYGGTPWWRYAGNPWAINNAYTGLPNPAQFNGFNGFQGANPFVPWQPNNNLLAPNLINPNQRGFLNVPNPLNQNRAGLPQPGQAGRANIADLLPKK